MKGEQSCGPRVEQVPLPLQPPAGWKTVGDGHEKPAPHIVPTATCRQAPLTQKPLPSLPQDPPSGQRPCGSAAGLELPTAAHVPCPFTLHA